MTRWKTAYRWPCEVDAPPPSGGRDGVPALVGVRGFDPATRPYFIPLGRCPRAADRLKLQGTRKEMGSVGKLIGIIVVIAIGVLALWLIVDRALIRFGAIGGLIFAFLLVYLLFYLADRRKIKEAEDLIAERKPFDSNPNVRG